MNEAEKPNYDSRSYEALVELSAAGDKAATECLLARYKNLVRAKARMYFLVGADKEDIIQEGMIGLFKAIRDFDAGRHTTFRGFAELCVKRQIITAVKSANRQKHIPLNSYISLSSPMFDDDSESALCEMIKGTSETDPERLFISKENTELLGDKIDEVLSTLEKKALSMYLDGKSYQEIAQSLNRTPKSIDNALQRVKKKMEKFADLR